MSVLFFTVSHFELFDFKTRFLLEKQNQIQMKGIKWNSKFTGKKLSVLFCLFDFYCFVTLMLQRWDSLLELFTEHATGTQWFPFEETTFSSVECYILCRQSIVVRFVWRVISLPLLLLVLAPRTSSHRLEAACCVATLRTAALEPKHTAARASDRLGPSTVAATSSESNNYIPKAAATCSPTNSVLFAWIMFGIQS